MRLGLSLQLLRHTPAYANSLLTAASAVSASALLRHMHFGLSLQLPQHIRFSLLPRRHSAIRPQASQTFYSSPIYLVSPGFTSKNSFSVATQTLIAVGLCMVIPSAENSCFLTA